MPIATSSSPGGSATGSLPSDPLQYCTFCAKPFTISSSYNRHVAYCRRKQGHPRKRGRSCRECSLAKAKCSFQARCSRCVARGLECVYERGATSQGSVQQATPASTASRNGTPRGAGRPANPPVSAPGSSDSAGSADYLSALDFGNGDVLDLPDIPQFDGSPYGGGGGLVPLDGVANQGLPLLRGIGQLSTLDMLLSSRLDSLLAAGGADPGPSLISGAVGDLGTLEKIRRRDPTSQQGASLILQALRSVPARMLHRETFPPFIHPQWHRPTLPEPLVVCMVIAHMFATGNQAIRPFLWRSILAEQTRLLREFHNLSKDELLAGAQAQTVYLLMRVIDGSMEPAGWNGDVLLVLCQRFQELCDEPFCLDELSRPSATWVDWIFAESRRRTSCAWFLMSRIVSLQTGVACHVLEHFRALPLPSSKAQWEARGPADWARLRAGGPVGGDGGGGGDDDDLWTLGGLLDTHGRSDAEPSCARRLDAWNARNDQLGTLMNIATTMIRA